MLNYRLKSVPTSQGRVKIILQNENGPCPLLAIANILLLQGKISFHDDYSYLPHEELISTVANYLLTRKPQLNTEEERLNYEQNVIDAVPILPTLESGLDVNVKFSDISAFEFTSQCLIFDLLNIRLVHGWLIDPQETHAHLIAKHSYNQLLEKLVHAKTLSNSRSGEHQSGNGAISPTPTTEDEAFNNPDAATNRGGDPIAPVSVPKRSEEDERTIAEGTAIESFLQSNATQLTYFGLSELHSKILEGELTVFFRNNHFSCLLKRQGELFVLVTDLGYAKENNLIWEKLSEVEGDSLFYNAAFERYAPAATSLSQEITPVESQASEMEKSDFKIAQQLQQQERQMAYAKNNKQKRKSDSEESCRLM